MFIGKKEKKTNPGLGASCFAAINKKEKRLKKSGNIFWGEKKTEEVGWGHFQTKK